MAVIVDNSRRERLPRQTLAFRGRSDLRNPSILDRHTDAAPRAVRVEDEIRDQDTPQDLRREAPQSGGEQLPNPPEN
jgi:hypothetical protein